MTRIIIAYLNALLPGAAYQHGNETIIGGKVVVAEQARAARLRLLTADRPPEPSGLRAKRYERQASYTYVWVYSLRDLDEAIRLLSDLYGPRRKTTNAA